MKLPPLSLYVHIPWCVRKCPYCDFNSHQAESIPEQRYVKALLDDLNQSIELAQGRTLDSIFFGGGTPSLFSADSIKTILEAARETIGFKDDIEITLEANPGTAEYKNLEGIRSSGVNRLSIGVQSFNNQHLMNLGRIHNSDEAIRAFEEARKAGFDNINLDLMHGLQDQTLEHALSDLTAALELKPEHISWYQLTIEPNTAFNKNPPLLPEDDILENIQDAGLQLLESHNYKRYEVSAFSQDKKQSKHNINYWLFGDYLAIGAGAHGKISHPTGRVERYWKTRLPTDYLDRHKSYTAGKKNIEVNNLPLEFLMNALRLQNGFTSSEYEARTGLSLAAIKPKLEELDEQGLIDLSGKTVKTSDLGYRFLNSVLSVFL